MADPVTACPNYINDYTSVSVGVAAFTNEAFAPTAQRLQPLVSGGYQLTPSDALSMVGICTYETISLGYSQFCPLFTSQDVLNYAYTVDLLYYYAFGPGAKTGASQGKGWVEEMIARITHTPITTYDSSTNSTFDSNPKTFPVNQTIYADATHDAYVIAILTALNISAIDTYGSLPFQFAPPSRTFLGSKLVPFNTELAVQVMTCNSSSTPSMRFVLNDAVLPLDSSYKGCPSDVNGLCPVPTVLSALQARLAEIPYQYACHGNWSALPYTQIGDVNGLPY